MSEQLSRYYENDLESRASAFGYNKNKNILIVSAGGFGSGDAAEKKEPSNLDKEKLPEILKGVINNDEESQTESKAVGKVKIRNINLNLILQI